MLFSVDGLSRDGGVDGLGARAGASEPAERLCVRRSGCVLRGVRVGDSPWKRRPSAARLFFSRQHQQMARDDEKTGEGQTKTVLADALALMGMRATALEAKEVNV